MNVFRHSRLDGLLVIVAFSQVALWAYAVSNYSTLSPVALLGCGVAIIFMLCMNYQCVAHNFIHNEFFKSKALNYGFSVVNSIALGMPQSVYKAHHVNHHMYNNDGWRSGRAPGDRSSLFYYGDDGKQESLLSYTFLSYFRLDLKKLLAEAWVRSGYLVVAESLALVVFIGGLFLVDSEGVLLFYLPVHYLGTSFASMENYAEHHGCEPAAENRNSVSCYGFFYNLLWFNNGYHQEHHSEPGVHWTQLPSVTKKLPSKNARRVVNGCHLFGLLRK